MHWPATRRFCLAAVRPPCSAASAARSPRGTPPPPSRDLHACPAGRTTVVAAGAGTVFSGSGDGIPGGAAAATAIVAAGEGVTLTLRGGTGTALVNALAGNEAVTLGSGPATVFGGVGD